MPRTRHSDLFSLPNFTPCLLARFFLTFARQMRSLVIAWQVYQLTKDPLALGLLGLAEAIPYVSTVLWAGYEIDHGLKRRAYLLTIIGHFFCSLALILLSVSPHLPLYLIYLLVALAGVFTSFETVAASAYFQIIVPQPVYSRAAAWHVSLFQLSIIGGPIAGGVLAAGVGAIGGYACSAVLIAVSGLFALSLAELPPTMAGPSESPWKSISEGIRYVLSQEILFAAMLLDMLGVLFGDVIGILPIFADMLGVGATGLGVLRASPAVGSLLMAQLQAWYPVVKPRWSTLLTAVAIFGVTIICFAFSRNFYLSVLLLAASGMADNISVVMRHSLYQAFTPDALRGRVASINGIFIKTSNEIGAFESGLAAKLMGVVPSVVFGGGVTLLVCGIMGWKYRGRFRFSI